MEPERRQACCIRDTACVEQSARGLRGIMGVTEDLSLEVRQRYGFHFPVNHAGASHAGGQVRGVCCECPGQTVAR